MAAKKLQHYFTEHEVSVVTSFPIREVVRNRDAVGRISKWEVELMGHDVKFVPRTAIKSQALANFIAEWTEVQAPTPEISHEYWTLYFDRSVMGPGAGAGVILVSPEGGKFQYAVRLHFPTSNNVAEYEALISGLRMAIDIGATRLYVYGDSKLVINKVMKNFNCESPLKDAYCQEVRKLEGRFWGLEVHHIPRKQNPGVDAVAKMATERKPAPDCVFVNDLNAPLARERQPAANKAKNRGNGACAKNRARSSDPAPDQTLGSPTCLATGQSDPSQIDDKDWRADLLAYLQHEVLPEDRNAAHRIARRAKTFAVIDGELYKHSPSETGILMKCIPIAQGKELLLEIHAGICGHHAAPCFLVGKAFRQGFYWPTALRNAEDSVRACQGCQFYAKQTHLPA
jgi:ribonuclease HI